MKRLQSVIQKMKKIARFLLIPIIKRKNSGELRRRSRYAKYYKRCRLKEKTILYEAFFGRGMLCNPYAIFLAMVDDPKYKEFEHIWVLDDLGKHSKLMAQYNKLKNVTFVQYQSRKYLKYLCSAKYLVNNSTFPSYFTKKEGQIYINTWHGIPLKTMGFDMPNGSVEISNTIRNLMHTDYLLSTSPILTRMYTDAYKLDGLYRGEILECGYPRLDLLRNTNKNEVLARLRESGVSVDTEREIILYAPTWRGKSFSQVSVEIDKYQEMKDYFDQYVDTSKYQLLIKVHQSVYAKLSQESRELSYMVPATIDANEMLSITDILISDFSSIFFDFLATDRPIIFFIPDSQDYENIRGTYFDLKKLPGSCVTKLFDLFTLISQKKYETYKNGNYQKLKALCCNYEIGNITPRIISAIWENKKEDIEVKKCSGKKTKLLIARGQMRVNGITTSLLNLLNHIDYTKFDVSLQVLKPVDKQQERLIEQINKNVRVFIRNSTLNVTLFEDYCQDISSNYGILDSYARFYKPKIFQREFKRSYGDAKFDIILDFDGYNTYFSLIHLGQPEAQKGIWMHNDMVAEEKLRFPWLKRQFELYPMYDYIISCSKAIMEVNRANLATEENYHKFTYAKNTIDYKRVLNLAEQGEIFEINGVRNLLLPIGECGTSRKVKCIALEPPTFGTVQVEDSLYELSDCAYPNAAVKSALLIPRSPDDKAKRLIRFVAVGRLSPEKNYINLIKAFHKFFEQGYNAMLYILGDGPQKKQVEKQIAAEDMKNRIILTGNIPNPFAVMRECDCFILPSLHEGQPMVIHEARILKKPIIMTEFSSAAGSVIPNGQFIIEKTVEGILEGMVAFAEGRVPSDYEFDGETYNKEAYEEFLTALDLIPQAETMVSNQ